MAMYSFTEFVTVLILYWLTSNYGDLQYLYIDLFSITTLALFMGRFVPRIHWVHSSVNHVCL